MVFYSEFIAVIVTNFYKSKPCYQKVCESVRFIPCPGAEGMQVPQESTPRHAIIVANSKCGDKTFKTLHTEDLKAALNTTSWTDGIISRWSF